MKRSSFIYTICGHILIHYEHSLFSFVGPVIASKFFPEEGFLSIYIAVSAGYWLRPFGAGFLAYIGDKFGRKKALQIGYGLLTIPTAMIGLCPEYRTLGMITAIVVIVCRVIQGAVVEGVFYGNITLVGETTKHSCVKSGLLLSMGFVGGLLGTGISTIFLNEGIADWGWRVPFIIGGTFLLVLLSCRKKLAESKEWEEVSAQEDEPLMKVIKENTSNILSSFMLGFFTMVPFYVMFSWCPSIMQKHYSTSNSFTLMLTSIGMVLAGISIVVSSWGVEKLGFKKVNMLTAIFGIGAGVMFVLSSTLYEYIGVQMIVAILTGCAIGGSYTLLPKLFPTKQRYSGVAVPTSLGQTLGVGGAVVLADLINNLYGYKYLSLMIIISFAMSFVYIKTMKIKLGDS